MWLKQLTHFSGEHGNISVQFSQSVLSDSLWPHGLQGSHGQVSLSITNSQNLLKLMSIESVLPFNHPILCCPLLSHLPSFPASGSFPVSHFFPSGGQTIGASASVLPMNIKDCFPLGLTAGSPCSPRDSQESSPTPQFKGISSSALSFLYSPALTSIHDYWKNHNFD